MHSSQIHNKHPRKQIKVQKSSSNRSGLRGAQRFNVLLASFFALMSVAGGYLTYAVSHAGTATYNANVTIHVQDQFGNPVGGADIRIRSSYGSPSNSWYCAYSNTSNGASAITDGGGNALFSHCQVSANGGTSAQWYIYYAAYGGYTPDPNSPYKVNTSGSSFTLHQNGNDGPYTLVMDVPNGCGSGTLNNTCPPPPQPPAPQPPAPQPPAPQPPAPQPPAPQPPAPQPPKPQPQPPAPQPPVPVPPKPTPTPSPSPGRGGSTPTPSPSKPPVVSTATNPPVSTVPGVDNSTPVPPAIPIAPPTSTEINTFTGSDSTITSDDGRVSALIPAGTFASDGLCKLSYVGGSDVPAKSQNLIGPYQLTCFDLKGQPEKTYAKAITVTFNVPKQVSSWVAYAKTDKVWVSGTPAYSKTKSTISFSIQKAGLVATAPKATDFAGILGAILGTLLFLGLIGFGILFFIRRRKKSADYDQYIQHQYIEPALADGAAAVEEAPVSYHGGARGGIADYGETDTKDLPTTLQAPAEIKKHPAPGVNPTNDAGMQAGLDAYLPHNDDQPK